MIAMVFSGAGGVAAAEELVLDDFEYGDLSAARGAWQAAEKSRAAELAPHGDGKALKMVCDFLQNNRRAVYDRHGQWDLSRFNRFSLQVKIPEPTALRQFIMYMHTGDGWLYGPFNVQETGWQTIHLERARFRPEDKPGGWETVDSIRLSAWKGADVDTYCLVDNLVAHRDNVLLLQSPRRNSAEACVVDILHDYGVRAMAIRENKLPKGDLSDFSVIILAHNPGIRDQTCQRLIKHVKAGGKLLVFYYLPGVLAEALGVSQTRQVADDDVERLAEMQFAAGAVQGMPRRVAQAPASVRTVRPASSTARVLGRWVDIHGKETDHAAVVLSETGAFVSVIPNTVNVHVGGQMLLALLGHFDPGVWRTAAQSAAQAPVRIGHLAREKIMDWVTAHAANASRREQGRKSMAEVSDLDRRIAGAIRGSDHVRAAVAGPLRDRKLEHAYLLGHKSRPGEFRAWWEHGGQGGYGGDWDKTMRVLSGAGFNAIVTNCLRGGSAQYESALLPVSPVVAQKGDQVAQAVAAGRKYDVEVHVWKVNFWDWSAPKDFWPKMRAEKRLQVSFAGEEKEWLCPSHPDNRELEVGSMVEVGTKYDVDGVHFDYIRYSGPYCYCDGCRERFRKDTGIEIKNWPGDTKNPKVADKWLEWRAEQITHIVRETERRVHAVKPWCKISAAVFPDYPSCCVGSGQDWLRWAKEGYVDFLCPMDYSSSDYAFAAKVAKQLRQVDGAVPIYPGIHASSLSTLPLTTARVASQIAITRNLGANGFTIFNYGSVLADEILPGLSVAITSEKTYVPHNGPRLDFELSGKPEQTINAVRVASGEQIKCIITRAPEDERAAYTGFRGDVVLESPDGEVLRRLGSLSSDNPRLESTFALSENGVFQVAVRGEAKVAGGKATRFTARSMPVVCGAMPPGFAELLPAE